MTEIFALPAISADWLYIFRQMGESVSLQTFGDSSRDNGSQTGNFIRTQKNEMDVL